jgi:hypothetical protein
MGVFDVEIVPGITVNHLALIRKPDGQMRVFGKGLFLKRHAEQQLIELALAASTVGGARG